MIRKLCVGIALLCLGACSPEEDASILPQYLDRMSPDMPSLNGSLYYSLTSGGSSPKALADATVAGSIYVWFEPNAPVVEVRFRIDDRQGDEQVERLVPYSLNGDEGVGQLNPYDTDQLSPGSHTLTVQIQATEGGDFQTETISFTVDSNEPLPYDSPIVITEGGTYQGRWESTEAGTPAVLINTSDPVVIENSEIRSKGELIYLTSVQGGQLTVRNVTGYGSNPNREGAFPGRFVRANNYKSVTVEHCYFENTSGILLHNSVSGASAKVLYNRARNIEGRYSDGNGGWQEGTKWNVQFLQLDKGKELVDTEVAWNQIVNEPYQSRVEDVINLYSTSGTSTDPIKIHDNYIQGAFPADPATDSYNGGGIMLGDNGGSYQRAYDNQVVSTSNYGIAIAGGEYNQFYNNRVVSSGYLADGTYIASQNVGIYIWNQSPEAPFREAEAYNNVVGWVREGGRNDGWIGNGGADAARWENNESIAGEITQQTEQAEWDRWIQKLSDAGVIVGPQ